MLIGWERAVNATDTGIRSMCSCCCCYADESVGVDAVQSAWEAIQKQIPANDEQRQDEYEAQVGSGHQRVGTECYASVSECSR